MLPRWRRLRFWSGFRLYADLIFWDQLLQHLGQFFKESQVVDESYQAERNGWGIGAFEGRCVRSLSKLLDDAFQIDHDLVDVPDSGLGHHSPTKKFWKLWSLRSRAPSASKVLQTPTRLMLI